MIDHDRLFKELLSTFFIEFLDLFLPEVREYVDSESLDLLDKEIFTDITSGERHEVDLVAKLKFKGQDTFFLVHVESQAQAQLNFGKRMHSYFSRLHEKHNLAVYPIALFTYDTPLAKQSDRYTVAFPDRTVLDFHFRAIQLNQLNWRDFARRDNPVASALMAKMRIASEERPRVRLECIRLLATLKLNRAKMQLILGFIDTYLRLNDQETRTYQAELAELGAAEKEKVMEVTILWKEEGRQEGLQQGLEQGLEQGLQQGLHQGKLSVIVHQIEHRFGPIEPRTAARIRDLSSDQLDSLSDALLDFTQQADLAAWLEKIPG